LPRRLAVGIVEVWPVNDEKESVMPTFSFCLIVVVASFQPAIAAPPEKTPDQVTMFTEGKRPMNAALSPDGNTMAVNVVGGEIYLCNALTGDVNTVLNGHSKWVWLEFSPDSKLLASGGSQDGQIRLWDVAAGKELALLAEFETQVSMVRVSPDGKTIACSGFTLSDPDRDGVITLWDATTQTESATFTAKNGLTDIAFSPDGKFLAAAEYAKKRVDLEPLSEVTIWNLKTKQVVKRIPNRCGTMSRLVFSPDSKTLAVAGYNAAQILQAAHRIALYDTAKWSYLRSCFGHTRRIFGLVFMAKGRQLMSCGSDGTLCKWDPATGVRKAVIATKSGNTSQLTISADGQRFAIVAKSAEVVRVNAVRHTPGILASQSATKTTSAVGALSFSSDGKNLAAARGRSMHYWDATNATDLPPLKITTSTIRAVTPDLRFAVTAYRTVDLWDVTTRKKVHSIPSSSRGTYQPIFSVDGTLLAASTPDQLIRIWETKSGRLWSLSAALPHSHPYLAFTADAKKLISGEYAKEGRIVIWDLPPADAVGKKPVADVSENKTDKEAKPVPAKVTASLKQAYKLVTDKEATVEKLQETLVPVLADLPVIAPHTGKQKPKWHQLNVNRDASRFAVVRFKSPLKKDADLEWVFNAPNMTNWYIVPVEKTMKGFRNFKIERDVRMQGVEFPENSRLHFQRLTGGEIKPGNEYLLWFRFDADNPVELKMCVHLSEAGTNKAVNTSTDIAKFVGLKTPLTYRTLTDVPLKLSRELKHGKQLKQIAVSSDGRFLASVDYLNGTKLWELETGKVLRKFGGGLIEFSPDGKTLAIALDPKKKRSILVVETETGKLLHELQGGHVRNVLHFAFSPDGSRLASGGAAGMVALWDVKTGKQNWTPFDFK
jgi:WD40 repeat protein